MVTTNPPDSECCLNQTSGRMKILIVLTSVLIHFCRGSFLYVSENYKNIYHYPNTGSLSFILATSLYSMSMCLHPRSLCIRFALAQNLFKLVLVLLVTNFLLVVIWQQLINLTVELVLILHDLLVCLHLPHKFLIDHNVAYYIGHLEGLLILAWVLTSLRVNHKWPWADDGVSSEDYLSPTQESESPYLHATSYDSPYVHSASLSQSVSPYGAVDSPYTFSYSLSDSDSEK